MTDPDNMSDDELQWQVFAMLAEGIAPVMTATPALDASQRDALRVRALGSAMNAAPEGTTTWQLRDTGWFSPGPFVEMKLLRRDEVAGTQELLVRFAPGARVPEHGHRKDEQMVVLEGSIHVGEHLLRQGDIHLAKPGSWHKEITTQHGGTVLLSCEYPLPVE